MCPESLGTSLLARHKSHDDAWACRLQCAQSLRAMRDLLVHSFEICALRGAFDEDERRAILQSAMALIQGQLKASQDESGAVPDFRFQVAPGGALSSCFSCAAGFVAAGRAGDGAAAAAASGARRALGGLLGAPTRRKRPRCKILW